MMHSMSFVACRATWCLLTLQACQQLQQQPLERLGSRAAFQSKSAWQGWQPLAGSLPVWRCLHF